MKHFCTYFDSGYLPRALLLYRSLVRHAQPFTLHVLCMDDVVYRTLTSLALPNVLVITLTEFESANPDLLAIKQARSRIEYYFTCSPALPLYIFHTRPGVPLITYLDADLCFYGDPSPLYEGCAWNSVLFFSHRFGPEQRELEVFGKYNVGFLVFKNDDSGRSCLEWWRARCLEWCHDRAAHGRFADQKYLESWPELFRGVHEIEYPGGGLGPWNVRSHNISIADGGVRVNSAPLVFYHFAGVKQIGKGRFALGLELYGDEPFPMPATREIYYPYVRDLKALCAETGFQTPSIRVWSDPGRAVGRFRKEFDRPQLWVLGPWCFRLDLRSARRRLGFIRAVIRKRIKRVLQWSSPV